jgi:hypothetical protein
MSDYEIDPTDQNRVMGLGARIVLARLDHDEEQADKLVNADVPEATLALVATSWAFAQIAYGGPEEARKQLELAAIRGDLGGGEDL